MASGPSRDPDRKEAVESKGRPDYHIIRIIQIPEEASAKPHFWNMKLDIGE